MAIEIPSTEPTIIRQGQTLEWTKSYSDYPATTYTLIYYLYGLQSQSDITITTTAYQTTDHLASEDAAVTLLWTFGDYRWDLYAEGTEDGTVVKRWVSSGKLTIKSSSGKSFAKTMLDAIEAILEGRGTSKDIDTVSKSFGGNAISRDTDKLWALRKQMKEEYEAEEARDSMNQGKASGNKIRVKFRGAS